MQVSQIVRENLLIDSKTYHSLSPIMKDAITDVFSFYKEHQFELFVYWLASVTAL